MKYTVWDEVAIRNGTAQEILQEIVSKSTKNDDIAGMNVKQYARALIENAPYYLPKGVLEEMSQRKYQTEYDKALSLLNIMPASRTRILATESDMTPERSS